MIGRTKVFRAECLRSTVHSGPAMTHTFVRLAKTGTLILPLVAAAVLSEPSVAQDAQDVHPCTTPEARAFDFWIGDWQIHQRILREDGTWLGLEAKTSVSPAIDGCALIERWEGEVQFFWEGMQAPEPMKALSVRAYDPRTGQWYIHWMDTRARVRESVRRRVRGRPRRVLPRVGDVTRKANRANHVLGYHAGFRTLGAGRLERRGRNLVDFVDHGDAPHERRRLGPSPW